MNPMIYLIFLSITLVAAIWGRISLNKELEKIASLRKAKLPNKPQTSISIERDGGQLWLSPFKVYIDGQKVGEVSPEELRYFEVSSGEHTVEIRQGWARSLGKVVNVVKGQSYRFQCGIKKMFYAPNAPVWSYLIFRHRSIIYLEQLPSAEVETEKKPMVIPLTIGFANLSGDDLMPFLAEDASTLGSMFKNMNIAPVTRFPSCEILFLYAHLREDGTLAGINVSAGLRQIAQLTGAILVVLASPNSSDAVQKCVALPGAKVCKPHTNNQ